MPIVPFSNREEYDKKIKWFMEKHPDYKYEKIDDEHSKIYHIKNGKTVAVSSIILDER